MKRTHCYLFVLLLLSPAVSQLQQQVSNGTIFGVVVKPNGEPARNLRLTARPSFQAGGHSGDFPHARTNNVGEYRFQMLPLWGRYSIYADDEVAGYSRVSTGPLGADRPQEAEITPEHPEAELNLTVPPKAGFVQIHLTNRTTASPITSMTVWVLTMDEPKSPLFTMSCYSDQMVLVPPDKNLLLHIKSDGFREWDESVGAGKPLNVHSGSRLTLDVQLDPSN